MDSGVKWSSGSPVITSREETLRQRNPNELELDAGEEVEMSDVGYSGPQIPDDEHQKRDLNLASSVTRGTESFDWSRQGSCVGLGSLALQKQICYELDQPNVLAELRSQLMLQWASCFVIGILVGTTAAGIIFTSHEILYTTYRYTMEYIQKEDYITAYLIYLGNGLICCTIAGSLTSLLEPLSGASGIPDVKSYLNGNFYPGLLRFRTLFCRVVGLTLSTASGLYVGKEGPVVHIGSIIASGVTQGRSKLASCSSSVTRPLRSDALKVSFISIGAATGVAAAFGAPIGGVLFSIEEASSHWSHELTWQSFFAAAIASFTIRFTLTGYSGVPQNGFMDFPKSDHEYQAWEIFPYLLLGVVGGVVGALFNRLNFIIQQWRAETFKLGNEKLRWRYVRILEILVILVATNSCKFFIPFLGYCREVAKNSTLSVGGWQGGQFGCPAGQYNELAVLFFNSQDGAINALFQNPAVPDELSYASLAVFFVFVFVISIITFGIALPSGLFVPNILIGSIYGRFFGNLMQELLPDQNIHPGTYSLIGAAAQLAGFSRMTVSLTVIVIELTNEMTYLLPVMLVITVAQWVGNIFSVSMYDMVIFLRRIPYLPALLPPNVDRLVAEDIMTPAEKCHTLPRVVRVMDVIRVLQASAHNGFPVYDEFEEKDGNTKLRVVGMVIRSQLISLMQKKFFADISDYTAGADADADANGNGNGALSSDDPVAGALEELSAEVPATGDDYLASLSRGSMGQGAAGESPGGDFSRDLETPRDGETGTRKFQMRRVGSQAELEMMGKQRHAPAHLRKSPEEIQKWGLAQSNFSEVSPRSPMTARESKKYMKRTQAITMEELNEMTAVEELHSDIVELTVDEMQHKFMDLTMFMDSAPVTVYPSTPFRRMYRIFLQMGMRHMAVVNPDSSLLGLITRKDLWVHAGIRLTDSCTRFNMRSGF